MERDLRSARAQTEELSQSLTDTQVRLRETEQLLAQQKLLNASAKGSANSALSSPARTRVQTYDALSKTCEIFRGLQLPSVGGGAGGEADAESDPDFVPALTLAADGSVPAAQIERALNWLREKVAVFKRVKAAFETSANALEDRWRVQVCSNSVLCLSSVLCPLSAVRCPLYPLFRWFVRAFAAVQHQKLMVEIEERGRELQTLRSRLDRLTGVVPRVNRELTFGAAPASTANLSTTSSAGSGLPAAAATMRSQPQRLPAPPATSTNTSVNVSVSGGGESSGNAAVSLPNAARLFLRMPAAGEAQAGPATHLSPQQKKVVQQLFTPRSTAANASAAISSAAAPAPAPAPAPTAAPAASTVTSSSTATSQAAAALFRSFAVGSQNALGTSSRDTSRSHLIAGSSSLSAASAFASASTAAPPKPSASAEFPWNNPALNTTAPVISSSPVVCTPSPYLAGRSH